MTDLKHYPKLTATERIKARQTARDNIVASVGRKPQAAEYEHQHFSRFSPSVERFVYAAMWLLLSAAFALSAVHIYFAASDAYGLGIHSPVLRAVGGVGFVVVAEIAAILFATAPAVYEHTITPFTRRLSYSAALVAGLVAIVFNIAVAIDYGASPFDWILKWVTSLAYHPTLFFIATVPPVFVLIVGQLQKTRILTQNADRFEARKAYEADLAEWEHATADPEQLDGWQQAYASALWDVWYKTFARRKIVKQTTFDNRLRVQIVSREMRAEQWFDASLVVPPGTPGTPSASRDKGSADTAGVPPTSESTGPDNVVVHLVQHPQDADLSVRDLAAKLDVSKTTAQRGKTAYRNNGEVKK